MPAILAPLASSVLSGPISSIVGGVVSSLAGGIGGAQGAQGNSPLGGIFSFASNLIGGLLGQKPGGGLRPPSGFPSPFQLPQSIFQNLGNVLQGIGGAVNGASQGLGGILAILQKVLGGQQGTAPAAGQTPFFPGIIPSHNQGPVDPAFRYDRGGVSNQNQSLDATIDKVGNKAQSLMDKAQELAASDNPADQMKAQRMMQQAQRMIEFMSGMIKIIGDMQKNAIQNMR